MDKKNVQNRKDKKTFGLFFDKILIRLYNKFPKQLKENLYCVLADLLCGLFKDDLF
jgi:hypothetical protein